MRTVFKEMAFINKDIDDVDVTWWVELSIAQQSNYVEPDLTDEKLELHHKATCCGNFERVIFTMLTSNDKIQHTAYCAWCAHKFIGAIRHKVDDIGSITIPFGKHKDKKLSEIPKDYLSWCADNFKEGNLKDKITTYLKSDQV